MINEDRDAPMFPFPPCHCCLCHLRIFEEMRKRHLGPKIGFSELLEHQAVEVSSLPREFTGRFMDPSVGASN